MNDDPSSDGEFYDHPGHYDSEFDSRVADVEFYLRAAQGVRSPLLECGIGTGRVAIPLAREGLRVVGVDRNPSMLASLRERLEREPPQVQQAVTYRQADLRDFQLDTQFELIIAPFNALLHLLTREDVEGFLGSVRRHLQPGGWLLFDYSTPRCEDLSLSPEDWQPHGNAPHPTTGVPCVYDERFAYDATAQVLTMFLRFSPEDGSAPTELKLQHRQFFPQELAALLHYNGFTEQEWTADFTSQPPDQDADTIVIRCRPPTQSQGEPHHTP